MQSRTRYFLLAGCITIFAIATPLIIIFVSGYRYNSTTHGFTQTGAISANSSPKGATLVIDGKDEGKTPQIVRFLNTGVYNVSLNLPGYFQWSKELAVNSQDVTLAHLGYNAVTLFFSTPSVQQISGSQTVLGFVAGNTRLVYATSSSVNAASTSVPNTIFASAPLPKAFADAKAITITASPAEDYFLLSAPGAEAVFVPSEKKLYPLNISVTDGSWQFGDHGDLYALQGQNLVMVNWQSGSTATIVAAPTIGYVWHDGYLYIIVHTSSGSTLEQTNSDGTNPAILYASLPAWQRATLALNQVNQIAIVADGTLYSFAKSLQPIESYVSAVSAEPNTNKFFYTTKNEIGVFDPATNSIEPITRLSESIDDSGASLSTGWAFYTSNGLLQIIEIDTRGNQNTYQLVRVPEDTTFSVDADAKYIYLLQNGDLERLQIR